MSSVKADSKIDSVNGAFVYIFGVPAQHPLRFLVKIMLPLVFFFFFLPGRMLLAMVSSLS